MHSFIFKKAFEYIDRKRLWCKLSKHGIKRKLLSAINSLYLNVQSCIHVDGLCSEYFNNNLGLMQDEILSPILFALFVNDKEIYFIEKCFMPFLR